MNKRTTFANFTASFADIVMSNSYYYWQTLWQLASLVAKLLYEYTPKMDCTCQQPCIAAVTSSYGRLVMPVSV
jgi:hypothetical protein